MASPYVSKKTDKICKGCGADYRGLPLQQFCSPSCYGKHYNDRKEKSYFVGVPTGTVGAISELIVSADLMKSGYEVYRALSPSSNCDVLAIKEGEMTKYEIRTGQYYITVDGTKKLSFPKQRLDGKSVAVVTHTDNKIHYFKEGEI